MATADRVLQLKLIADVGAANKSLKQTEGRLKSMGRSAQSWGKALTAGLVVGGIEKVTDALGDAWAGFRSGERVTSQLKTTWDNLGLAGEDYAKTLDAISASTLRLGTSDDEAVQAFNDSIKRTKDQDESMRRLAIAQDLAASKGISLSAAMKIVDKAADGSAKTVKEFGLKSKTAGGRIDELGDQVKGAADKAAKDDPFGTLNNALSEMLESLVGGALGQVMTDLGGIITGTVIPAVNDFSSALSGGDITAQVIALAAGIGLLAAVSYAHPIVALVAGITALGIVTAIAVKDDWFGQLTDSLNANREAMETGKGDVDAFGQALVHLGDLLNDTVGPFLRPFFDIIGAIWSGAMALINLDFDAFLGALGEAAGGIKDLILAPFQVVFNLIPKGFKDMFGDVGQHLRNGARLVLDLVYGVVNKIIDALNMVNDFSWQKMGFDVDLGPLADLAGQPRHHHLGIDAGSFRLWPELKHVGGGGGRMGDKGHHEKGLWSVPFDDYPAWLHQGEMVVPSDFAQNLRGGGGMGGDTYITVNVNVGPTADKASIGQEIISAIQAAERRQGKGWRN